jgi:hypothetical protein
MRPLGDLEKQFGREYKNHPGCVPIVEFSKGSYMPKEKKHGKKYFPQFKIVDWIDEAELDATYGEGSKVDEGDDNDNLIEAPKTEVKKAAPKAAATTKPKAAPKAAPVKEPEPEVEEAPAADETRALTKAELLAIRKAELKAQMEAEMAALEAEEGGEEVEEAAEEVAEEAPVETAKPAPAESRSRRRSF